MLCYWLLLSINDWLCNFFNNATSIIDVINVLFCSVLLAQYCAGDKIKKNEMSGAGSAYGGGQRRVQDFGEETWEKETTGETQA